MYITTNTRHVHCSPEVLIVSDKHLLIGTGLSTEQKPILPKTRPSQSEVVNYKQTAADHIDSEIMSISDG